MNDKLLSLFGLKFHPFRPEIPAEALHMTPTVEAFCGRVEFTVGDGGFVMVTGEPGSGKSVALRLLAQRLRGLRDVVVGTVNHPQSRVSDFYRELGDIFGVPFPTHNRWAGFKTLRARWGEHIATTLMRPVLIVDEAQEMLSTVFGELRVLTSKDFDSRALLCVVLAGDARLPERLRAPDLLPLGSRIRRRLQLEPASRDLLCACLDHVLDVAGNPGLMTTELKATIAEHAAGNYRVMMNIADELLVTAAERDLPRLDEKLYLETFQAPVRDLIRYRHKLVSIRTGERNRLLKLLETANIKVSSVATDVFGKSGMAMLEAIANGEASGEALAGLARGLLKKKRAALTVALEGRVEEHHRFLLRLQLDRLAAHAEDLRKLDEYIDAKMEPYRLQQKALEAIPGVGAQTARAVIAEIGVDMSAFKNEHHLAAWAGVCPGNNESAGKRLSGRARKGNVFLRTALVEASRAAVRKKGGYLRSKYYRLKARAGGKRAALAIAHKLLIIAYRILADGTVYKDLGDTYLDTLGKARTSRHLVRRLEALGFRVQIEPTAA